MNSDQLLLKRGAARHIVIALSFGMVMSCATTPAPQPRLDATGVEQGPIEAKPPVPEEAAAAEPTSQTAAMFVGNDQNVNMPVARPPLTLAGDAVMLNFEQAPLNEVIHTILGDTLELDYVIENQVQGEITLRTRSPIERDQLLPILESLLRNNNVLMIRGPGDRFYISGSPNIVSTVPFFESMPAPGYTNVIVPLQYIGAAEMADILRPVAREDTFVRVDPSRNLLI